MKVITTIFIFTCLFSFKVFGQELTLQPGGWGYEFYEDDTKITKKLFEQKLQNVPEAYAHWKKMKVNNIMATIGSLGVGASIVSLINKEEGDSKTAEYIMLAGSGVLSTIFNLKVRSDQKNALLKYNASFDQSFRVSPASRGIGLALHF